MRDWNLEFADSLTAITGRQLPTEKIYQAAPEHAVSFSSIKTVLFLASLWAMFALRNIET